MASSRALRKSSRMASPMDVPVKESLPSNGGVSNEDSASFEEWKEPPLRAPAPSFEDYKGLERQGVLKHMAPLGSLPNQKVKLRLKAYDTSRQSLHARNGEVTPPKEEITQPNPLLPSVTRRSEPRKVEDRPLKLRSSRERDDDQDYTPKGVTKTTPAKASPSQTVLLSTPSCRTSAGQARLRNVVKSAVERSNEIGNPILGLAVKKLFEESLQNRMLADLLDAVLSQRPTPRQAADFQGYIRVARKQIKAENSSRRHSSNGVGTLSESTSTSPTKSARPSVARQIGITKDLSDTTGPNKIQGVRSSSTKQPSKNMEDNNHVAKEERPAKRRKRSRSASTSSSLSSLPSTEDRDFSPTLDANLPSGSEASPLAQAPNSAVTQSSLQEPRLHTFLTTKTTSLPNKRPAPVANLDEPAEQLTAKRQKLQQTFEDYTIKDSGIRAAPAPKKPAQIPTPPTIVMSTRAQQPRLRNGTSHRSRRDEHDELRSPSCSTQGELLIPPPAGAQSSSRGVTPSHLGRPLLKHPKKAARVKMS